MFKYIPFILTFWDNINQRKKRVDQLYKDLKKRYSTNMFSYYPYDSVQFNNLSILFTYVSMILVKTLKNKYLNIFEKKKIKYIFRYI